MALGHTKTFITPEEQDAYIESAKHNCTVKYGFGVLNDLLPNDLNQTICSAVWDGILCWPNTLQNTVSSQPCPHYIAGFDTQKYATRECMNHSQWFIDTKLNKTWTNYSQCSDDVIATVVMTLPSINATLIEKYIPIIKIISRIGYFVSFSTLLVAFLIMFSFKKLHCARNKLHMHLFASFIFRAFMAFLKDILFIHGVGMSSDLLEKDGNSYFVDQAESKNWGCKLFTSFWQYFITANYSWILMEGLYLHNLILLALFSDSSNSIKYYIILGWGLPLLVVGPWIAARLTLDNNFCWTIHSNHSTFLIIRIPTMISNLINLLLFINIARVLFSKLSSPVSEEARRYRRWIRSTLVLVPLFGIHYALFVGMSYAMGINQTVELIWLFCDQLFASFQGFFVAVLFCFLNGEVRTELRPHINHFTSTCLSAPLALLFNCGDISSSSKGRPSVCTTLSCSSLYNSTATQKFHNRRNKWDMPQINSKTRHSIIQECSNCQLNGRSFQNISSYQENKNHNCNFSSNTKCNEHCCLCVNGLTQATETTTCLVHHENNVKLDSLDLEMVTMAHH